MTVNQKIKKMRTLEPIAELIEAKLMTIHHINFHAVWTNKYNLVYCVYMLTEPLPILFTQIELAYAKKSKNVCINFNSLTYEPNQFIELLDDICKFEAIPQPIGINFL